MNELDRIVSAARASIAAGEPSALATILGTRGSSFRRAGTRLWIGAEQRVGAISGGCLESDLAERAKEVTRFSRPALISYDSSADGDVLWGMASGCGGILQILLEPLTPSLLRDLEWIQEELEERRTAVLLTAWDGERAARFRGGSSGIDQAQNALAERALSSGKSITASDASGGLTLAEAHIPPVALTVFGSGADARATSRLAGVLGWRVLLLASAPETEEALAKKSVLTDERSAALLMTHNFHRDAELLGTLGRTTTGYIGVLGPRRRTLDLLAMDGMPAAAARALHSPPGLDIGGETPDEIALSLLAEIQAHFAGRSGGKLRERSTPIHDREESVELPRHLVAEREP
ncbi:MAG TPA: XdhC family protein [Thermoanaerobaculia bacterium]|nr:XdhC family protein [Thermoanaerobaculia bacterium]